MDRRELLKLALASPALMSVNGCQLLEDEILGTLRQYSEPFWGHDSVDINDNGSRSASDILSMTPADQALNILVMGDSGSGDAGQLSARDAIAGFQQAYHLDLVLHVGDLFYDHPHPDPDDPSYTLRFSDPYDFLYQSSVPFYAWPGNHDHKQNGLAGLLAYAARDNLLQMPDTCYGFNSKQVISHPANKPAVEIFGVDTFPMVRSGTYLHQLAKLDQALGLSDAACKLVVGHHPLLSNGSHGSYGNISDLLQALCEQHGVLAYLAGHEHDLQLLKPEGGVHYLISGGGGAGLRPVDIRSNTRFAGSNHGAFVLHFTTSDAWAIPLLGESVDQQSRVTDRFRAYPLRNLS